MCVYGWGGWVGGRDGRGTPCSIGGILRILGPYISEILDYLRCWAAGLLGCWACSCQVVMLWLWLSYRFDNDMFPQREQVRARARCRMPARHDIAPLCTALHCHTDCPKRVPLQPCALTLANLLLPAPAHRRRPPAPRRSRRRRSTSAGCWTRACSASPASARAASTSASG